MMDRRTLLQSMAALGGLTLAGRVWAAPQTNTKLLVVFLRGAYDAANIIIPTGSDFYYRARPNLAVPRPGSRPDQPELEALALDGDWSLHPALKESLLPLWQKREIAFVPFAGTDDLTRSHFETQDTIELGQSIHASRDYKSGFLARLAGALTGTKPIAFTNQLPLIFQGPGAPVPNIGLNTVGRPAIDDHHIALISEMYKDDSLAAAVAEGFHVRDDVYRAISRESDAANRGAVSPKGFELSGRRIAQVMKGGYNLGFVDVGGWDTHVNQGAATGYLADRMGELGRGLVAFADEIGAQEWRDTVVVVISEFGRTFRENGDKGTDHGHGSTYWVLGGGVNGGRFHGPQVKVEEANLFQNRDFPVLTDYRGLFGGLFRKIYGFDTATLNTIFPTAQPIDLALV
jgi:uncharacterized protein (DUF1501 family)